MALSNRDLVGKMLDELAGPLHEFLDARLGSNWIEVVRSKERASGADASRTYNPMDPQEQLKAITMGASILKKTMLRDGMGHNVVNYASELRAVRNGWAHHNAFTADEALRALDTGARLLALIGAKPEANRVRHYHRELNRRMVQNLDRKTLQEAANVPASQGLKPWREVLRPHDDVASGRFHASEFAADLHKVAFEPDAVSDYSDAQRFFERTYLTEGLRSLVSLAARRLRGDANATPVINLQTNFGGGKTHSMLTLWHLAGGHALSAFPQEFQELLTEAGYASDGQPVQARRVAIVGNHLAPQGSLKSDGTKVNTMWGELAWQLGGREAYELVADSDASGTHPGDALRTLLSRYSPAVILIDEWVAYARALLGKENLAAGTFDTQFTFAQSLTEVAKSTPGILLAISIPASHDGDDRARGNVEEVGGEDGQAALKRLQNVVRRVADQWRPASSMESYHIVRQRLFQAPDADAQANINATAKAFVEFYTQHSADFPKEARDYRYEERIRQTYPIHPEMFDRLYEDWSTLERFQRTRGVLRLMNAVIHRLWASGDESPMIMPGSVPLYDATVNSELTQYLPDSWKAIIDADVDGEGSEPWKIDAEKPLFGARQTTKRLARGVFFGAAPTIGAGQKGIDTQRLFLGVATPGDTVGNFHSALANLSDRTTHFYGASGRYWYDLQANISRRAKDQAERLHVEEVWAEIRRRLEQQERGTDFVRIHVCPEESGDVLDTDEVRLVILHPATTHRKASTTSDAMEAAKKFTSTHGSGNRVNRNMLVYLAADETAYEGLEYAVRDYLGWSFVLENAAELDLTHNQRQQAEDRQRAANSVVNDRLLLTYIWALVPTQDDGSQPFAIEAMKADSGSQHSLAARVARKLGTEDLVRSRQSAAAVRIQLDALPQLWRDGHVSIGTLWKLYAEYPYMPRLRDVNVLISSVTDITPVAWESDSFALADGVADDGTYRGLWLPDDRTDPVVTMHTLIVRPDVARAQRDAEQASHTDTEVADGSPTTPSTVSNTAIGSNAPASIATPKTRLFASTWLSPDAGPAEFFRVNQEILKHLIGDTGTQVRVRLEIEATRPSGFDEHTIRTVSENANTLGFEESSFED